MIDKFITTRETLFYITCTIDDYTGENGHKIAELYADIDKSISKNVIDDGITDINILKYNYIYNNLPLLFNYICDVLIEHDHMITHNLHFLKKYNYMYSYVCDYITFNNDTRELLLNLQYDEDELDIQFYLLADNYYEDYDLSELENKIKNASDDIKNKLEEYKKFYTELWKEEE